MCRTEGRVHEGRFELECPTCGVFLAWSGPPPAGIAPVTCEHCGERFEVLTPQYSDAHPEPLTVQPLREIDIPHLRFRRELMRPRGVIARLIAWVRSSQRQQLREERAVRTRIVCGQASLLAKDLRDDLEWFRQQPANLARRERQIVDEWLEEARRQFAARDCSRFWNAMAKARDGVRECVASMHTLCWRVDRYTKRLQGRQHTFPSLPIAADDLPAMAELFEQYRSIARQAEADPEFGAALARRKDSYLLVTTSPGLGTIHYLASTYTGMLTTLRQYPQTLEWNERIEKARARDAERRRALARWGTPTEPV